MDDDIERARSRFHRGVIAGVTAVCEDLVGAAQQLAPVDEGTLRGSGDVDIAVTDDAVIGTVSFNTIYAARQHEELDWRHPKGGQAKYLEGPLLDRLPRYEAIIAASARKAM